MAIEPALVGQWYDLNMREGQREAEIARNRQFTVGHTAAGEWMQNHIYAEHPQIGDFS